MTRLYDSSASRYSGVLMLSQEDLRRIVVLARLEFSDEEIANMGKELDRILAYVGQLSKIDTSQVPESEVFEHPAEWRKDEAFPIDDEVRALILSNFSDRLGDVLRVPAIFENPK